MIEVSDHITHPYYRPFNNAVRADISKQHSVKLAKLSVK